MATNYPGALDNETTLPVAAVVDAVTPGHNTHHPNVHGAVRAVQAVIGPNADVAATATSGKFLGANGDGTSSWKVPPDAQPHVIQDESTPLTQRGKLSFQGAGVAATDDGVGDRTIVTIPGLPSAYSTIQEESSPLTQRAVVAFQGSGVVAADDAANDRTIVTIPGLAASALRGAYALVAPDGASYTAVRLSDNSAISSSASFRTVLQAAIDSAAAAGGGRIELAHGAYSLDTSGVTISNPGLIQLVGKGGHSFNRQNSEAGVGTVITATGTWTADTDMIHIGALGAGNYAAACLIADIAFNGAGKDINIIHGQNAQDLKIENCTFRSISKVNPRKFIWLESDQATNAGSGANYKILNCWGRSAYHVLYTSGTGGSDGEVLNSDFWSCVRTMEIHNGGFQLHGCHLVGNATDTDYHLLFDGDKAQISGNYFDSCKTTGSLMQVNTGSVKAYINSNLFFTGVATAPCILLQAPRAVISSNTFDTGNGPFVKFNGVASTFGLIIGNGGQGPTAGIIQDQTGADITADASGTNFRRLANIIL